LRVQHAEEEVQRLPGIRDEAGRRERLGGDA
jgi:hypothetical protein